MSTNEKENVLVGFAGAFLFALIGGVVWFVLYQIGFLASLSGIVSVFCAIKGYGIFTKTKGDSVACLIVSAVAR